MLQPGVKTPSVALIEGRDRTIYWSEALHQLTGMAFVVLELQEICSCFCNACSGISAWHLSVQGRHSS